MADHGDSIHALIAQLPEIYQPILGYPEYDARAARAQDERLREVLRLHDSLVVLKGRPLKVLDLGCAQGYFSLSMAARGAHVRGIDYLDANIAVCRRLAEENPHLSVQFDVDRIEAVVEALHADEYDLVLGLSVFHHLVYIHGAEHVRALLERVAESGASLLTEMALASEPLYWAHAQPERPSFLLEGLAFVRCLGKYPTHLSDIQRPMYFASNDIWYLGDIAARFHDWRRNPHGLEMGAHRGTRAYYFAETMMAKKFAVDGELADDNRDELDREEAVLRMDVPGMRFPRVIGSGEAYGEKWLVREIIPGRLLSDALDGVDFQGRGRMLGQVLEQLAALEAHGLYHSDVCVWNVLLDEGGIPHLIDYGAIGVQAVDCLWPHEVHLAFIIFAQELVSGEVEQSDPLRRVALSPGSLAPALQSWANFLFQKHPSQWSFAGMHEALSAHWNLPVEDSGNLGIEEKSWMALMEQALQVQLHHAKHLHSQIDVSSYEGAKRAEQERAVAWSEKEQVRAEAVTLFESLRTGLQNLHTEQVGMRDEYVSLQGSQVELRDEYVSLQGSQVELRGEIERLRGGIEDWEVHKSGLRDGYASLHEGHDELERKLAQLRHDIGDSDGHVRSIMADLGARLDELAIRGEAMRVDALAAGRQVHEETVSQIGRLAAELQEAKNQMGAHGRSIDLLHAKISTIEGSRSWRWTAPLRAANRRLARLKLGLKIRLRPVAVRISRRLIAFPSLVYWVRPIVLRHPRVADRLRRFMSGAGLSIASPQVRRAIVPKHGQLSQRAHVLSVRIGVRIEDRDQQGEG